MKNYFLDTDVIIDFSRGRNELLRNFLERQKKKECRLWVNAIVMTEFFTGKSLDDKNNFGKAKKLFDFFGQVEIGEKVALKTGELLREGKIDYLADGYIASSCLLNELILVTNNKKHFKRIEGLKVY